MVDGGRFVAVFVSNDTFDEVGLSKKVALGFVPGSIFMYCAMSIVCDDRKISASTRLLCSVMWVKGRFRVEK